MKITAKIMRHLPKTAQVRVCNLLELQDRLNELRRELRKVIGGSHAKAEFQLYTDGWLKTFADDADQSGSIASLIEAIVGQYVDEDGEPWKEKH